MLDIPYKKTGAQNAYISYEKLESRLKAIPQEFFVDVLNFFDLLEYKIDVVKSEKKNEKKRSVQEGLDLLEKIAGCVPESVSLEDAKAEYFAEKSNLDYIITRDKENGFKNSPVKSAGGRLLSGFFPQRILTSG